MATVSIDKQINSYLALLANKDKESILDYIKAYVNRKNESRLKRENYLVQYNNELDEAMNDARAGRVISQEELEKESETW